MMSQVLEKLEGIYVDLQGCLWAGFGENGLKVFYQLLDNHGKRPLMVKFVLETDCPSKMKNISVRLINRLDINPVSKQILSPN